MTYGYSAKLIETNREANASSIGVRLGRLCIEKDVPVIAVASRLGVTRQTVYNWFSGATAPQGEIADAVEALLRELS